MYVVKISYSVFYYNSRYVKIFKVPYVFQLENETRKVLIVKVSDLILYNSRYIKNHMNHLFSFSFFKFS